MLTRPQPCLRLVIEMRAPVRRGQGQGRYHVHHPGAVVEIEANIGAVDGNGSRDLDARYPLLGKLGGLGTSEERTIEVVCDTGSDDAEKIRSGQVESEARGASGVVA